jgi:hypothetical protein
MREAAKLLSAAVAAQAAGQHAACAMMVADAENLIRRAGYLAEIRVMFDELTDGRRTIH